MIMKTIYAFMMVLFFTSSPVVTPAFAQEKPLSADEIVSKMQSKLNLTQDQVTAVTPIIEKYSSKRQELRQSIQGTADKESLRSQMKQLKADESRELSQVLSLAQMSQWKQMQNQDRRKHNSDSDGKENNGASGNRQ